MSRPEGFAYIRRKSDEVVISRNGHEATTLRGKRADKFIRDLENKDPQELMARLTGNYKRGNERR